MLERITRDMPLAQKQAIEQAEQAKIERHFRSQRELPNGRDFRWNMQRDRQAERNYRRNFDRIFPNAPCAGI